jgi:hypothetical protein
LEGGNPDKVDELMIERWDECLKPWNGHAKILKMSPLTAPSEEKSSASKSMTGTLLFFLSVQVL